MVCSHCGKRGHDTSRCWTLHPEQLPWKSTNVVEENNYHQCDHAFFWTIILGCPKCKRDSLILAYPSVSRTWFDTMIKINEKQVERGIGMVYFQKRKKDPEVKWKKKSQTRIGSIAFISEASRQGLKSVKMKMESWDIFVRSRDSGGVIISPKLMNYVMIPYKWKRFICHIGRARDQNSTAEIWLVAGGKERKEGRQTIFFTPLDPFNSDANEAESITDIKKPRKVQYQIHWRPEQDAVYQIHLSTAQDAGPEFWQTGSNAMITNQSVPKESVVKVASESGKRIVRKTAHTSRTTKSNTQTIIDLREIQYCKHASGTRE